MSNKPEIVNHQLSQLTIDEKYQSRVKTDPDTIEEYAELMRDGADFKAVDIFDTGSERILVHGFHRAPAFQQSKGIVPCIVHTGTVDDALWFALGANHDNPKQMTSEDKKSAATKALINFTEQSDAVIAKQIGCCKQFVNKLRNELTTSSQLITPEKTIGLDGKARATKPKKEKPESTGIIQQPVTSYTAPDSEQGDFDNVDNSTTSISDNNSTTSISDNRDSSDIDSQEDNIVPECDVGTIHERGGDVNGIGTVDIHNVDFEDSVSEEIIDPIDGKVCQPLFAPVEETVLVKRSVEFLKFSQFWNLAISEFAKITNAEDKKLALTTVHSFSISNE